MDNDRVPRRALLGLEDARHRCGIQSICAQPIDRFLWAAPPIVPAPQKSAPRLSRAFSASELIEVCRVDNKSQRVFTFLLSPSRAPASPPAVYSLLTMPVETEIKFCVDDLADIAQRAQAAGFTLETPRAFETNVLYDTPDRRMRARTEILRIRSYAVAAWTLTHKRLPDVGPGDRHAQAPH